VCSKTGDLGQARNFARALKRAALPSQCVRRTQFGQTVRSFKKHNRTKSRGGHGVDAVAKWLWIEDIVFWAWGWVVPNAKGVFRPLGPLLGESILKI